MSALIRAEYMDPRGSDCARFMPVSCSDYSWALKKETKFFSEISVDFTGLRGVISQKIELSEILWFIQKLYSSVTLQEVSRGNLRTCLYTYRGESDCIRLDCSILVSQIGLCLSAKPC
jgi:hypothetical protein